MRKVLILSCILFCTSAFLVKAFASEEDVLGVATNRQIQIPPIADGPGLILPDSPFFFLDKLKQQTRLLFALTPDAKARVYNSVAGERLAELRIMLDRNNRAGITIDLREIADNEAKAADQVRLSNLLGKDIIVLARNINTSLKEKLNSLDILISQASGDLSFQAKTTRATLIAAKVVVEKGLPRPDMVNEMKDDLNREISYKVEDASQNVQELSGQITLLSQLASQAAQQSRAVNEKELEKTIAQKSGQLEQQKQLLTRLQKQDQMYQLQNTANDEAAKALEDARTAIEKYQEAEQSLSYLQTHTVSVNPQVAGATITPPQTPSPTH